MENDSKTLGGRKMDQIVLGERDDTCTEAGCIDELVARAAALGFSRGELERLAEVYGLEFAKDMVARKHL
ncbi:MAG: hypothetical protein AAF141_11970 [Pseudomonadota bacterium]